MSRLIFIGAACLTTLVIHLSLIAVSAEKAQQKKTVDVYELPIFYPVKVDEEKKPLRNIEVVRSCIGETYSNPETGTYQSRLILFVTATSGTLKLIQAEANPVKAHWRAPESTLKTLPTSDLNRAAIQELGFLAEHGSFLDLQKSDNTFLEEAADLCLSPNLSPQQYELEREDFLAEIAQRSAAYVAFDLSFEDKPPRIDLIYEFDGSLLRESLKLDWRSS